jgi:hypothetical protein
MAKPRPATGRQLWRLNDLELLPQALAVDGTGFITGEVARMMLSQAKAEGHWDGGAGEADWRNRVTNENEGLELDAA